MYEDIYDAKNAVENLNGFNVGGRYLIALYYSAKRLQLIKESTAANSANTTGTMQWLLSYILILTIYKLRYIPESQITTIIDFKRFPIDYRK